MNAFESPRRVLAVVSALLLAALTALLLLPGQLPTVRGLAKQEGVWVLPVSVSVDADTALSVINQRRLFGLPSGAELPNSAVGGADEKSLTPPDWRIAGAYAHAGQHVLLIGVAGQPVLQPLRVGDALPGGAKIVAINSERVSLLLNGQRVSLSTYPQ